MKVLSQPKKLLAYLAIGCFLYILWGSPEGAAESAGRFLGIVGSIIVEALNKASRFLDSLSQKNTTT